MDWEPRVGMKVVCIDDSWPAGAVEYPGLLMVGAVYTIRHVGTDWRLRALGRQPSGYDSIWLEEVRREIEDFGFGAFRFKPLRERKTDISIFTALLTKAPTPEKEPA